MTRSQILDTAKSHVTKDRASAYGEPEDSFGLIASLWSAYRGEKFCAYDAAMMMALLKVARAKANPGHLDSVVDGAGYLACAGEIAGKAKGEYKAVVGPMMSLSDLARVIKAGQDGGMDMEAFVETGLRRARDPRGARP